jgi:predicted nucleic acid-binding protein
VLLLDSDVLIDIQRGHAPAVAWFSSLIELPAVPGLVAMELIQDAENKAQVQKARKLVAPFPLIWPTDADCGRALTHFERYHLSHSLGLLDALIAASAVGLAATLCTFNLKHYRVIPDLVTDQPYMRQ